MEKFIYQIVLTPEDGGGYSVEVPDLPGCFTYGDTVEDAASMAADAANTDGAARNAQCADVPKPTRRAVDRTAHKGLIEVDSSYIVSGEVVSAAEAARMLGVSAGRVTHMIDSGVLQGYRRGRRTYVTVESVEERIASNPGAGRPKAAALA